MSALKDKFDPDKREPKQSVVQRFITDPAEQQPQETQEIEESAQAGGVISEENGVKYMLFNAMEEAVREEVGATMSKTASCKCERCYHDVCAIVLNNMPPQYVTTQKGVLIKKATVLLSIEALTKLSNEIFKAMDKIKNNPAHE